jgi:hypothetical protein
MPPVVLAQSVESTVACTVNAGGSVILNCAVVEQPLLPVTVTV